jgi:maltose O-acetyltransferase
MEDYEPRPRYYNVNKLPILGVGVSLVNTLLDCNDQITIGDHVSFGHNCMILTGYHDMYLKGEKRQLSSPTKPVMIKDGAWIASGVIILPGITIGENSVIGAGSIVTHNVPDNVFVAGNPAKVIRSI